MSDGKKLALLLRSLLELEVVREAVTDPELRAGLRALTGSPEEEPQELPIAAKAAGLKPDTVRAWIRRDPAFVASGIATKRAGRWYAAPAALRRWAEERGGGREPRGPAPRRRAPGASAVLN